MINYVGLQRSDADNERIFQYKHLIMDIVMS